MVSKSMLKSMSERKSKNGRLAHRFGTHVRPKSLKKRHQQINKKSMPENYQKKYPRGEKLAKMASKNQRNFMPKKGSNNNEQQLIF